MTTYKISVVIQPFILEGKTFTLFNDFVVRSIGWSYKYTDVGIPSAQQIPVVPVKVSVGSFLVDAIDSNNLPLPQKVTAGMLECSVINTNIANSHKLEVDIYLSDKAGFNSHQLMSRPSITLPAIRLKPAAGSRSKASCDCSLQTLIARGCQDPSHT